MLDFADGYQVFADDRAQWLIARPDGRFLRLGGPPEVIATLITAVRAGTAVRTALDGVPGELAEQLLTRGVLIDRAQQRARFGRVLLDGENALADALQTLLITLGHKVIRGDALTAELSEFDAVAACATVLPDTRWQRLDARCAETATAWHRGYGEGDSLVLGPCTLPARTASYRDTRGRLLAASLTPDELAALWRHGDTPDAHSPRLDAAAASVAAGLLALDLDALLRGDPLPSEGQQLVFHPGSGRLTRHPVLPLPSTAALPFDSSEFRSGAAVSGGA